MATTKLDGRLVSLINGHYENETSLWNLEEEDIFAISQTIRPAIVQMKKSERNLFPAVGLT